MSHESSSSIAIVGMACRFPGAPNVDAFWKLLESRGNAIVEVPADRWDLGQLFHADPTAPGRVNTRWGGFLPKAELEYFDAAFFNLSPREAKNLDPQQRLTLKVAWEALENAGVDCNGLAQSRAGVFIGAYALDNLFRLLASGDTSSIDAYTGSANVLSAIAGRLSYFLGLRGPSMAVDTACSSSLVTLDLARKSLLSKETDLAIAGGVNVLLSPEVTMAFTKLGAMAPDGKCKTFDESANGYVRSEGCGIVVLKRLADAVLQNDRILAVIRGSAVNHDGHSNGFTAPSAPAQEALVRSALEQSQLTANDIDFIETHGTGTLLGDQIEVRALGRAFSKRDRARPPIFLGAVKTNIGHTEGAAGIAGVIKAVLAIQQGRIPSNLHLQQASQHLPWQDLPFQLPNQSTPWESNLGRRTAGVSSFGLTGTNAHLILQEFKPELSRPRPVSAPRESLLLLSAKTSEALRQRAQDLVQYLDAHPETSLEDVCYTASARRTAMPRRMAVTAKSTSELKQKVRDWISTAKDIEDTDLPLNIFSQSPAPPNASLTELGRLFCAGQNIETQALFSAQARCIDLPAYPWQDERHWLELAARAKPTPPKQTAKIAFVFPGQGAQWVGMGRPFYSNAAFHGAVARCAEAMRGLLTKDLHQVLCGDDESWMEEVDIVQPALFAMQIGIAHLLHAKGIKPECVLGHSMGEVAAACVAGALSIQDAARVICVRSQLVKRTRGQGGMALAELTPQDAEHRLAPFGSELSIAAINGPRTVLISGSVAPLSALLKQLERDQIFCRAVKVDYASHCSQMDVLREDLLKSLDTLKPLPNPIPFLSTVEPGVIDGQQLSAEYWFRNLRQPVQFAATAQMALQQGVETFVEISAHPLLFPSLESLVRDSGKSASVLASVRREHPLESLAELEAHFENKSANDEQRLSFLGKPIRVSSQSDLQVWDFTLTQAQVETLSDHVVDQTALMPGTAAMEMALEAISQRIDSREVQLEKFDLTGLLPLEPGKAPRLQASLTRETQGRHSFQLSQAAASGDWHVVARGSARLDDQPIKAAELPSWADTATWPRQVSGGELYVQLNDVGLDYGPAFQKIQSVRARGNEAVAHLKCESQAAFVIDPTLLDAVFHASAAAMPASLGLRPVLLKGVERLRVRPVIGSEFFCHIQVQPDGSAFDARVVDGEGKVVVEASSVRVREMAGDRGPIRFVSQQWEKQSRPEEQVKESSLPCQIVISATGPSAAESLLLQKLKARGIPAELLLSTNLKAAREQGHVILLAHASSDESSPQSDSMYQAIVDDYTRALQVAQSLMTLRQREGARMVYVTAGAQKVAGVSRPLNPAQAPWWGLARTIALEVPSLKCTCVDLDVSQSIDAQIESLVQELMCVSVDTEVAYRSEERWVGRLCRVTPEAARTVSLKPAVSEPFALRLTQFGDLDSIAMQNMVRCPPSEGEIEVEVEVGALNFRDLLEATEVIPVRKETRTKALGCEGAGRIVAIGPNVTQFKVGDEVIFVAPYSFASFVTMPAYCAVPKPKSLSMEEAATLPTAHVTVYHSLVTVARLTPQDRILIHTAAGAVGLSAVQWAKQIGAKIFATAGSEEKRDYLRKLGIEHVSDSRSDRFVNDVLKWTQNEGVDVVLNTLPGRLITESFGLLRDSGRFIELGKLDYMTNARLGLAPFLKGLSFSLVDFLGLSERRPEMLVQTMNKVLEHVATGAIGPLPFRTYPASQTTEAFRYMASGTHVGKILVSLKEPTAQVKVYSPTISIQGDATYLITGGLGGLGLDLAKWFVQQGARHLVLVGRSKTLKPEQHEAIAALVAQGAKVTVESADISRFEDVTALFSKMVGSSAPLRGIVHAAAVLEDGTLEKQTVEQFERVMAPKIRGAWNLHRAAEKHPLDFFIMYSSAAGLLGSPGQGNYAAANTFLDALAHLRESQGLPAMSLDWGAFSEVGLAVQHNARISQRGMATMTPAEGTSTLTQLLKKPVTQLGIAPIDSRHWSEFFPHLQTVPRFSPLLVASGRSARPGADAALMLKLQDASAVEAAALLEELLRTHVARILRTDLTRVAPHTPFKNLGMDSLMGLELRNRLEAALGMTLPSTLVWTYPTIQQLARHMVERLNLSPKVAPKSRREEFDAMSEAELAELGEKMLA